MPDRTDSNWRTAPAFNGTYESLADCVGVAINEFQTRQGQQFVITRHLINPTWHVMPWSQWRTLPNDHPANPSIICFFGTFPMFRELCHSFPPDLFHQIMADPPPEPDGSTSKPDGIDQSSNADASPPAPHANGNGNGETADQDHTDTQDKADPPETVE